MFATLPFNDEDLALEYKTLLENLQGGVLVADYGFHFHLRYVSNGLCKLLGYKQEELLSKGKMAIMHPDDRQEFKANIKQQLLKGDFFEAEYRLRRKDGSFFYGLNRGKAIYHKDGKRYIHCLLTDRTPFKAMEQKLSLSHEKYLIAMGQAYSVVVEYNPKTQIVSFSDNYASVLGMDAFYTTIEKAKLDCLLSCGIIYAPDRPLLADLFAYLNQKMVQCQTDFRVVGAAGGLVWCSLNLKPLLDKNGLFYGAVGQLQNIDRQKQKIQRLEQLTQLDSLTGIYNSATLEQLVDAALAQGSSADHQGFLLLDVDNFKLVNETWGHAAGDLALCAMVKTLQGAMSDKTIFGRLGGDEFVVFVKSAPNVKAVEAFAKSLISMVQKETLHIAEQVDGVAKISISVGCVLCGDSAANFNTLCQMAAFAMGTAKKQGKSRCVIWQG